MADKDPNSDKARRSRSGTADGEPTISADDFQASFGEDLRQILNLENWRVGVDMSQELDHIDREVREALAREDDLQRNIRRDLFPILVKSELKNAGVHQGSRDLIETIYREFLFGGGIEACDGLMQIHDTLPLTIYQIGVTLVSYTGNQESWGQRLFRRDLRQSFADPVEEVIAKLERRQRRGDAEKDDALGEMVQYALLHYAERAILLHRSKACWRMGHGNPIPYELLTGGHNLELMVAGTKVLRELVEKHQKFIFVGLEPRDRLWFTIAQALRPLEYAIVSTLDERLEHWLHQKRFTTESAKLPWDDETIAATEWIPRVIREVASKIVVGFFRTSMAAPAQTFYAHVDHADYAAHMVLADSLLQEQRGRPLLIEIARQVCANEFRNSLETLTKSSYAALGVPWGTYPSSSEPEA